MADPIAMKSTEKVTYQIGGFFVDEAQTQSAKVDGPPIAEIVSGDGVTLNVAADGMSGEIVSVDLPLDAPAKVATVRIKADANLDPNVQAFIEVTQDFVVTSEASPMATTMSVVFGAAEPK